MDKKLENKEPEILFFETPGAFENGSQNITIK